VLQELRDSWTLGIYGVVVSITGITRWAGTWNLRGSCEYYGNYAIDGHVELRGSCEYYGNYAMGGHVEFTGQL
jgi:hypothetical protein